MADGLHMTRNDGNNVRTLGKAKATVRSTHTSAADDSPTRGSVAVLDEAAIRSLQRSRSLHPSSSPDLRVLSASSTPRKRSVVTNLPGGLAKRLRDHADTQSVYLTEVLLVALESSGDLVPVSKRPGDRRRRRRVDSSTAITWFIDDEECGRLDDAAERCRMSRSEFVTALLEVSLAEAADPH